MKLRFQLPKGSGAAASCISQTEPADCGAKKGWWTLGSWTGVRMPLNTGCHRYADRGTAARFGNDPG